MSADEVQREPPASVMTNPSRLYTPSITATPSTTMAIPSAPLSIVYLDDSTTEPSHTNHFDSNPHLHRIRTEVLSPSKTSTPTSHHSLAMVTPTLQPSQFQLSPAASTPIPAKPKSLEECIDTALHGETCFFAVVYGVALFALPFLFSFSPLSGLC